MACSLVILSSLRTASSAMRARACVDAISRRAVPSQLRAPGKARSSKLFHVSAEDCMISLSRSRSRRRDGPSSTRSAMRRAQAGNVSTTLEHSIRHCSRSSTTTAAGHPRRATGPPAPDSPRRWPAFFHQNQQSPVSRSKESSVEIKRLVSPGVERVEPPERPAGEDSKRGLLVPVAYMKLDVTFTFTIECVHMCCLGSQVAFLPPRSVEPYHCERPKPCARLCLSLSAEACCESLYTLRNRYW